MALLALLLGFALRGGLFLHLFGVSVQRSDGRRARRWRCLLRSLVALAPLLVVHLLRPLGLPVTVTSALSVLLVAVFLSGVAYAIFNPARGIQDLAAGTTLVPK